MSPSSPPDTAASAGALVAAKLRGAALEARHLPRALRLVWAASRRWRLAWVALLPVQGLLPAGVVYLTRELVDGLVAADVARVAVVAAILGGLLLATETLHGAS